MAAQPSTQPELQCCICEDEFSNVVDLAAHLIRHAEERQFQEEISDNGILYEEPVATDPPTPYKSSYPEYTTMDFDKTQTTSTDPPPPRSKSPLVFDIDSDSDDDSASKSKQVVPAPVPQPPPVQQLNFNFGRRRGRQPGRRGQH